jgi:hypothetical protein
MQQNYAIGGVAIAIGFALIDDWNHKGRKAENYSENTQHEEEF